MSFQTIKQNLVYIGIAVIVFAILSWFKPAQSFQPTGIILPMTKEMLLPTMANVQLFEAMPSDATQLATINVEGQSTNPTQAQQEQMLATAKGMVQQAGGDGLVVTAFGYEGAGADNPAPLAKYVFFGTAIKQ